MLRSLYSGVTGLNTHQSAMDVIGNNIANVNTIGFKAARASFEDLFSQTISPGASASAGIGGRNPLQIGLGVTLGGVDNIFTQGGILTTNSVTDLSIQGDGFFIVTDGNTDYYTRAGNFSFDSDGNFVNNDGLKVKGFTTYLSDGETIDSSTVPSTINIPSGMTIAASPTQTVSVAANLNATSSIGSTHVVSLDIYDSLGATTSLTITFEHTGTNEWTWTPTVSTGTVSGGGTLTFDGSGALSSSYTDPTITFNPATGALTGQTITLNFGTANSYDGITQLSSPVSISTTISQSQDGYSSGTLETFLIDDTGIIIGIFTNGTQKALAQIALASFNNPRGLIKKGGTLYLSSRNSGTPTPGVAGEGGRGKIAPSSLEMSNVDLSRQFTDMIVVERGFQANSRIITTGDEMLQEVINLKR